jgi:aminoglycoside phosphotransferase (APT) family kinase protein
MPSPPWRTDRSLTASQARAAIGTQFPELAPVRVKWMGAGWDNDVYLANDAWIFRFPRRREVARGLELEVGWMRLVAGSLAGSALRVPEFEKLGRPGPSFPYRFAGYRALPGVEADRVPAGRLDQGRLARALGELFSRLHAIPAETAARLGVEPDRAGPEEWLAALVERADVIRPLLPRDLLASSAPWLSGAAERPPPYSGPPRLIHNDIGPQNILIDAATGQPRALIDFGDVALGDPALDLVGLQCWLGRAFVTRLLENYELPVDERLRDRVSFLAIVMPLCWLGDAFRRDGIGGLRKHQAWVRRALEP